LADRRVNGNYSKPTATHSRSHRTPYLSVNKKLGAFKKRPFAAEEIPCDSTSAETVDHAFLDCDDLSTDWE